MEYVVSNTKVKLIHQNHFDVVQLEKEINEFINGKEIVDIKFKAEDVEIGMPVCVLIIFKVIAK